MTENCSAAAGHVDAKVSYYRSRSANHRHDENASLRRIGALDSWGSLYSTPISCGMNSSSAQENAFCAALAEHNGGPVELL